MTEIERENSKVERESDHQPDFLADASFPSGADLEERASDDGVMTNSGMASPLRHSNLHQDFVSKTVACEQFHFFVSTTR